MNDINYTKYISIEEYGGNWRFSDKYTKVADNDIACLKPLTKEYSSILWSTYVSKSCRHIMLMDNKEWPRNLEKHNYNWEEDWNLGNYDGLRSYLKTYVPLNDSDTIYFFWMKEDGIETTWSIFLKYWINFLYDDEGPLIICANSAYAIRFGQGGVLFIGKRQTKV